MEAPGGASPLSPELVGRLRQEHEKVTAAGTGREEGARRGRGLDRGGGAGRGGWGGRGCGGAARAGPARRGGHVTAVTSSAAAGAPRGRTPRAAGRARAWGRCGPAAWGTVIAVRRGEAGRVLLGPA